MGLLNSKVTVYSVDLACSLADFLEAFSGYKLHCDLNTFIMSSTVVQWLACYCYLTAIRPSQVPFCVGFACSPCVCRNSLWVLCGLHPQSKDIQLVGVS